MVKPECVLDEAQWETVAVRLAVSHGRLACCVNLPEPFNLFNPEFDLPNRSDRTQLPAPWICS